MNFMNHIQFNLSQSKTGLMLVRDKMGQKGVDISPFLEKLSKRDLAMQQLPPALRVAICDIQVQHVL